MALLRNSGLTAARFVGTGGVFLDNHELANRYKIERTDFSFCFSVRNKACNLAGKRAK